jgi:hypothetical protein
MSDPPILVRSHHMMSAHPRHVPVSLPSARSPRNIPLAILYRRRAKFRKRYVNLHFSCYPLIVSSSLCAKRKLLQQSFSGLGRDFQRIDRRLLLFQHDVITKSVSARVHCDIDNSKRLQHSPAECVGREDTSVKLALPGERTKITSASQRR